MVNAQLQRLAQEWLNNADDALGYAETGLPDTSFYTWICFLCQQAVELYLKGFLMLHGKDVPKIHDLVELLKQCQEIEPKFTKLQETGEILADYYIETRYLPDVKHYTNRQAQEAVSLARKVKSFLEQFRKKATSHACS